ncbi:MAG: TonB-dependent receptor, partial [Oxalobacter sp.]|nr:TonB-dependent receptor [Oxalobacter sp.]
YAITPDLSLLVGNRLDRHENYGNHHSPRGYLVYSLTDKLTIKGGAGRGFKAPTLKQLSPSYSATGGGGSFTIYGNPDLNPEINTSYELNIDYTENNWSAHIGLFKNNVRDLIQTRCISNCGIRPLEVRTYTNVDKADIRGIELGFRSALIDHLVWSANYTYLDARDATSDERLLDRSRHLANTTLEWKATDRLSLQLRGQYTGSQLGTDRVPLPAYSIWGLETSYRIYKDVALHFAIENIADKRPSDDNGNFSYTEPGRSFNLLLTAGF